MLDPQLIDAYRFFSENAGYIVGRHAESALSLARAELRLREAQASDTVRVEWQDDDFPYDHDGYTHDEIQEKFASTEWTGPYACLLYLNGEVAASLGGIVVGPKGTNDSYCRVVEAELADEVFAEIDRECVERERWANQDLATV